MSFQVTKEAVQEMLDDDPSLRTISNQMSLDETWDLLEGKDQISSENELFEALMDVMYATRPKGVL
jgi:hypothetical protein